jgi:translation initiation factor 4A
MSKNWGDQDDDCNFEDMTAPASFPVKEREKRHVPEVTESFDKMGLSENLLRGIYAYGFEKPSAIQSKAITPIIEGRDTLAQAQSGTGKTATFSIGALQRIDPEIKKCQVLIMAPTRELVDQIQRVVRALSDFMSISTYCCIGGRSVQEDGKQLRKGVQLIVGSPGRVLDLVNRKMLSLDQLKVVVLDEADEMLSVGFKDQVWSIFERMPRETQVCLFSATMPVSMVELSETFMREPARIIINQDEVTLEGIKQYYVNVECEEWKFDTLCDLYDQLTISQAIIYCSTRSRVDWLAAEMNKRDFSVTPFHSELTQEERDTLMKQFRSGNSRVLISTDILGRGIDVQQVSMVFNYDLPPKKENYIHRIGRSGRFGRKGVAINLVTKETILEMQHIQSFYSTQINELPHDLSALTV